MHAIMIWYSKRMEMLWCVIPNILYRSQHWLGNGLVPPGNKAISESMMTQVFDAIRLYEATMGWQQTA